MERDLQTWKDWEIIIIELDYKVMDVTTQITVDIYIINCTDPDVERCNRIFFPFAWLVTWLGWD